MVYFALFSSVKIPRFVKYFSFSFTIKTSDLTSSAKILYLQVSAFSRLEVIQTEIVYFSIEA